MFKITISLLVAIALLGVAHGADSVLTATGANFDGIIQKNDFVVMEFYASWCGHCKKLAPEYEKAAQALKSNDPPIVLAKMEATEEGNKEVAAKYGVQGYPSIKVFRGGDLDSPVDFKGPRDADGIVSYLRKQAGPAYIVLKGDTEIKAFQDKELAVIGVFKPGSAEEKALTQAADALRDEIEFAVTPSAAGLTAPAFTLYKQFDDREMAYDGPWESKAIQAWLASKSNPLVPRLDQSPRNQKAVNAMFSSPSVRVVGVVPHAHKSEAGMEAALYASARKHSDWRYLLIDSKANAQALSFFGLTDKDVPAYVLHDAEQDFKYLSPNTKASGLDAFLDKFQAGKLERHIKSEEAPASNDGPVKVVTANTFDKITSGQNVLLEFYAPWCGHCKNLAPIYEKVGEAFSKNKSVTIAKIDATANDVPKKFEVTGFPTISLLKADGSILPYSGDRSEADMIKFVEGAMKGAVAAEEDGSEDSAATFTDEL